MPVKAIKPKEGTTGWSDTWMISSKAKNPNCMYAWMDYIISPVANAQATVWFGEAPVSQARAATRPRSYRPAIASCSTHTDEEYFKDVYYWNTPTKDVPRRTRRRSARTSPSGRRPGRRSRADRPTPAALILDARRRSGVEAVPAVA